MYVIYMDFFCTVVLNFIINYLDMHIKLRFFLVLFVQRANVCVYVGFII